MEQFDLNREHIPIVRDPFKRTFDIFFSTASLILLSPILLTISLLVKLSSKGPVLYGHGRVGRGGKAFRCLKFRTMYPDADKRLQSLLNENPEMKAEWERSFKLRKDPRVTPIGAFLRKFSLDELPQFWNVLRGDLSVVGPRPLVREEVETRLGEKARVILSIRPGLTCLWQVSGRSDTDYQQRIQLDETYLKKRNLAMDLKLIALTLPAMIFSKGAY